MKILVTIAILFIFLDSCNVKTCDITDYKNGDWNKIDSTISYKICNTNKEILLPNDSIRLEFLGVLIEDQKILIQNNENLLLFSLLVNIPIGEFQKKEIDSTIILKKIFPIITKNSECLLKFNLTEFLIPKTKEIINLYFKNQTNTSDIIKLNQQISSLNNVDSVIFVSSDAALEKWSQDVDSSWKSFLKNNPLPATTNIYIKRGFYNSSFKDSLTNMLSKENIVSEIVFPKEITSELSKLSESLKFPFFIKIKTR